MKKQVRTNTPSQAITKYINAQPKIAQPFLKQLRAIIQEAAPKAEEKISWGMPAFMYHGQLVLFAAFKDHYSLFPANATLIATMKNDLKAYKTSKGTIQFSYDKPLPVTLIKKIVKMRVKENELKKKNK